MQNHTQIEATLLPWKFNTLGQKVIHQIKTSVDIEETGQRAPKEKRTWVLRMYNEREVKRCLEEEGLRSQNRSWKNPRDITVLLALCPMLYSSSLPLIYFIARSLYFNLSYHFTHSLFSLPSGNQQFVLHISESVFVLCFCLF